MEDPKKLEEGLGQLTSKDEGKIVAGDVAHDISTEADQKATSEEQPLPKQKTKRVATLDAFRGLTIVVGKSNFSYSTY